MKRLLPNLLASGDDDGVIKVRSLWGRATPYGVYSTPRAWKLWDPRKPDAVRQYTHHFDFISDFMWLDDKKQLVATRCVICAQDVHVSLYAPLSGDGSLSVMDVRSKKVEPFAQSEDQEDELLSILPIKGYALPFSTSPDRDLIYTSQRAEGRGRNPARDPLHLQPQKRLG